MHLGYTPKFCLSIISNCFIVRLREIEDNGYAKFWGVKKLHYGLREMVNEIKALEINATLVENDFRMKEMNAKKRITFQNKVN